VTLRFEAVCVCDVCVCVCVHLAPAPLLELGGTSSITDIIK